LAETRRAPASDPRAIIADFVGAGSVDYRCTSLNSGRDLNRLFSITR